MSKPQVDRVIVCVPVCVPRVSQRGVQGASERVCPVGPLIFDRDTHSEPSASESRCVSRPYFQLDEIRWHYPDENHPSSQDFPRAAATRINNPCPTCGAPPVAACVTKRGRTISGRHSGRARNQAGVA